MNDEDFAPLPRTNYTYPGGENAGKLRVWAQLKKATPVQPALKNVRQTCFGLMMQAIAFAHALICLSRLFHLSCLVHFGNVELFLIMIRLIYQLYAHTCVLTGFAQSLCDLTTPIPFLFDLCEYDLF